MAALTYRYSSTGSSISSTNHAVSPLLMMQARLREQQLLEKEARLLEMAARQQAAKEETFHRVMGSSGSSLSSSLSSLGSSTNGGRVRKLFEERRHNKGYDRGYPLDPVDRTRPPIKGIVKSQRGVSVDRATNSYLDNSGMKRARSQAAIPSRVNRGDVRSPNKVFKPPQVRPQHHKSTPSLQEPNREAAQIRNSAPSSQVQSPSRFGFQRSVVKAPAIPSLRRPKPLVMRQENRMNNFYSGYEEERSPSQQSKSDSAQSSPALSPVSNGGISNSHTSKQSSKPPPIKPKAFDAAKMRTKGTEAEKFVARGEHLKPTKKSPKVDWRKQHEDFINTVRAAKGMKGYEAPALDTTGYIECPHCGRKFSEGAADRHIPKCANIQSNKSRNRR